MTRNAPSNSDDMIDSRDVIARIEELESERAALVDAKDEAIADVGDNSNIEIDTGEVETSADVVSALADLAEWDDDNGDELKALKALADEGENSAADWPYGATLVRESYFTDYCEELVSDIGDMPREIPGYIVIDWEATANNIRADYSEVDFDGVTYLVR